MVALAVRLPSRIAHVPPFEGAVADLPVLDRSLSQWQAEQLQQAGLTLTDAATPSAEVRLWFEADAVFTAATLRALLKAGRRQPVQAAVAFGTPLYEFVAPLNPDATDGQPLRLPLWAGPAGSPSPTAEVPLATVCDEATFHPVRVAPVGPAPHVLRIPDVDRLGGRMCHWLHALNLNQALLETERRRLGALGRTSVLGSGLELAPTSLIEGSVVGDGCVVEAQASVLDSYLGEGVRVAAHAALERCVIGAGCHTLIDTHLRRVIAHRGSTLSNVALTDVVLGEGIFITTGVTFFAGAPGELVVVEGESTRRPILGGAVGPRAILGARALFDAGMAVPPGTVVVGRPDEAASGVTDEKLARVGMWTGGE